MAQCGLVNRETPKLLPFCSDSRNHSVMTCDRAQPLPDETNASRPDAVGEQAKTSMPRAGSKLARVIDLLQRSDGAPSRHDRHLRIAASFWLNADGPQLHQEVRTGGGSFPRTGRHSGRRVPFLCN